MLQEKEKQLKQYELLTKAMLGYLTKGAIDDFFELLDQREACINKMKQLDEEAGAVLMNDQMQKKLQAIVPFEKKIESLLQEMVTKIGKQARSAQNETFLAKQYENPMSVSGGIFYDKRK